MKTKQVGQAQAITSGSGIQLPMRGSIYDNFLAFLKTRVNYYSALLFCASAFCIIAGLLSPSYTPVILGDIAFALVGALNARRANTPWYITLLSGLSTYSFGGGLIRDQLLLGKKPWFLSELGQFVFVAGIIFAFIFFFDLAKNLSAKWDNSLKIASWVLISCDSIGLVQFAQLGHNKVGDDAIIPLMIAGSIATMIGGGLLAIFIRGDYIPITRAIYKNRHYYMLAVIICVACFVASLTGIDAKSTLAVLSFPSIAAGLLIEKKHIEIYKMWNHLINLVATMSNGWVKVMPSGILHNPIESIHFKRFIKHMDKQIKLRLNISDLQYCLCCSFHRKQGLMA